MDDPLTIVCGAIDNHVKMINEYKGVPGVQAGRLQEGYQVLATPAETLPPPPPRSNNPGLSIIPCCPTPALLNTSDSYLLCLLIIWPSLLDIVDHAAFATALISALSTLCGPLFPQSGTEAASGCRGSDNDA